MSEQIQGRTYEVLNKVLAKLKSSKEVSEFLDEFLTPTEKIVLAKRISIGLLIKQGYRYDQIRKILRVTPATISRVAVMMRYTGKAYHQILEKVLRSEEVESLFKDVAEGFLNWTPGKGTVISSIGHNRQSKKNKKAF